MVRTQIQLTEQQQCALREISLASGRSMADLVREGIEKVIAGWPRPDRESQIERAIQLAGRFSSRASDVSKDHDRYLGEAFR